MVVKKQEEMKPVKYIEVELDADDEGEELQPVDIEIETTKHGATDAVGAATKDVRTAAAEGVGGRAEIALMETERVMSPDSGGRHYRERARLAPGRKRQPKGCGSRQVQDGVFERRVGGINLRVEARA
jgi:hypothetical protein